MGNNVLPPAKPEPNVSIHKHGFWPDTNSHNYSVVLPGWSPGNSGAPCAPRGGNRAADGGGVTEQRRRLPGTINTPSTPQVKFISENCVAWFQLIAPSIFFLQYIRGSAIPIILIMEMVMTSHYEPLVTTEMLERWKQEDARLDVEERYIRERRGDLRRLIDAGTSLAGPGRSFVAKSDRLKAPKPAGDPSIGQRIAGDMESTLTFPEAILSYMEQCPRGEKSAPILAEMKKVERFKQKMDSNPNAGYSALSDLVRSKRLVKDGELYLHPRYSKVSVTESHASETLIP